MSAVAVAPAQQHAARRPAFEVELQAIEDYRRFAALTIQRYYRGWIVRLHKSRQEAALCDQRQTAAAQEAEARRLYKAARIIQDCWRSYRNRRIYRFYRDLIKFREAADPRQLLRSINAAEAALVEPAAGLHIRFRLGGSSFPPILLYKLFTHRPVTDVCAFGPRNYAAEAAARKAASGSADMSSTTAAAGGAAGTHQKSDSPASCSSSSRRAARSGWYCRDDRNGWRPVIELQQHQECPYTHGTGSSSGSSRPRHKPFALTQRRTRLQLASSKASNKGLAARGAEGSAELHEQGYSSEPELQRDRGSSSPCEHTRQQKQQQYYHHSPLVRRAEHAQRLKQRRRQWLLKMHKAGMQACAGHSCSLPTPLQPTATAPTSASAAAAGTGGTDPAVCLQESGKQQQQPQQLGTGMEQPVAPCQRCSSEEQLLRQLEQQLLASTPDAAGSSRSGGSSGMQAGATSSGGDAAMDTGWDLDELLTMGLDAGILAWASRLDFDTYQQDWSSTAVTMGSEAAVPFSERAILQQLD